MLNLLLICTYCGKKWERTVYGISNVENERCSKCGDTKIEVRDNSKSKVDYYSGCPAFPKKPDNGGNETPPWGY